MNELSEYQKTLVELLRSSLADLIVMSDKHLHLFREAEKMILNVKQKLADLEGAPEHGTYVIREVVDSGTKENPEMALGKASGSPASRGSASYRCCS